MKYIKVAEIKDGKEHVIFENSFKKIVLCTDEYQGCIGIEGPMDMMKTIEEMVQSWCIGALDVDESSSIDDLIETVVLQASIGVNIALLGLGPMGDTIVKHEDDPEILAKGKKLIALAEDLRDMLAERLDDLTAKLSVQTIEQFNEERGRELMEELEEFEKHDDK